MRCVSSEARRYRTGSAEPRLDAEGPAGHNVLVARLLVVDDATFVRRWCRSVLEGRGYEVAEALDGPHALSAYRENRPDLVLLDIYMHPIDGITVLRDLRELDPTARVVMLTSARHLEVVVEARRLGALDYVLKPCASDRLIASIERALG
jgi:two-component system chemotaxis response regulator CheY